MKSSFLRPDGFATGLFVLGLIMLVVPMMVMPGVVSILASLAYWLIMVIAKLVHQRRT